MVNNKLNPIFSRRELLKTALATLSFSLMIGCQNKEFVKEEGCANLAGKQIRWIIPHAVGGGYDNESRILKPFYEKRLAAEIFLDNVPGAAGVIGAKTIATAKADGLTLGILGATGLMLSTLIGQTNIPNPVTDFSILGRVSRSWQVWVVGKDSPLKTFADLLAEAKKRPIIFGANEVGNTSFTTITIGCELLGINSDIVAGFSGTRNASLAAIRGEVDCVSFNFDSIFELINSGELRPILQFSNKRISEHPLLEGVPLLGGSEGVALEQAKNLGKDLDETNKLTQILIDLISVGRIVVAPLGLSPSLFDCLSENLYQTLSSTDYQSLAKKDSKTSIDIANSAEAKANLEKVAKEILVFVPIIKKALEKARK
ncbi:MAG: tripartite tricarboxylate transporter substrate-binding protein [Blastocatellia bacterium]